MLVIPETEIRASGAKRNPIMMIWQQWRTERRLAKRGIRFRRTSFEEVLRAYAAMNLDEFDAINGLQEWANWRTIPRALSGHVADGPLRVLDLGCGSGASTRVLAHYCAAGSHITGYEIAAPMLDFARRRTYLHRSGSPAQVDFLCQGVTDALREPDASVDVVNASGVVGHHLRPDTIPPLIAELKRVMKPDAVAMLDAGPTLPAPTLRQIMTSTGFEYVGHYKSWFGDRTGEMVFRRSRTEPEA